MNRRRFLNRISICGGAFFASDFCADARPRRIESDTRIVRASNPARLDPNFRWFALPIEINGLTSAHEFVPVSCRIDFTDLLNRVIVAQPIDERTIRLYQILSDGREFDIPVQFSSFNQPRQASRHLLSGTRTNVSYLAEFAAGEIFNSSKTAGELTWIAEKIDSQVSSRSKIQKTKSASKGSLRYRLVFGIPKKGRLIQVPFLPQNLRGFDDHDRATTVGWFPRMQIRPKWPFEGKVDLLEDNQLLTSYHLGPSSNSSEVVTSAPRRPFFYPVNGPDGFSLTEFGKPHDPTGSHAHHYSLWIAHANVNGHDFWSERGGIIAHEQFERMEDGPVFCRLIQKTRWKIGAEDLLHERRHITAYFSDKDFSVLDLETELTPATPKPVSLGKTSFGFLAARVAQSMTVFDGGGEIINSQGDRNEQNAHLKHAQWLDQSGPVSSGKWAGVALFDHPSNPNYPTGWHCRNDGWAGAAFNMESSTSLESGKTLRLRYRVLLHRHNSSEGQVARRYQEYSAEHDIKLKQPTPI